MERAWHSKEKVKQRLIGDEDPEEWDLPPKPKGMRWRTYDRLGARYDAAEEALDQFCAFALMRLMNRRT